MMQCVRRCSFICGAVLSILLLLCSCQAGAGPLILPDNVPSKNTSQGKEKLLAALNTVDIRRPETTQDSYIQGADSVAETIFLCIQKESGNNAAAAIELLSESRDTGLSNCADVVLNRLSPSPDETYLVSYALLSADVLEDGALRGDADLSGVALTLLTNRTLLVYSDSFSAHCQPECRLCRRRHRRSGARRGCVRFLTAFFKTSKKMTAAVSCSAAVIFSVHPIGRTILYSYNKGSCQRLSTEKKIAFCRFARFHIVNCTAQNAA